MRSMIVLAAALLSLPAQETVRIALVVDPQARPQVANALRAGVDAASGRRTAGGPGRTTSVLAVRMEPREIRPEKLAGFAGVILFADPRAVRPVLDAARTTGVPVVDLGMSRPGRRQPVLSQHGDLGVLAADAAWWVFGPLAHHDVLLLRGSHPEDRQLVRLLREEAKRTWPRKRVLKPGKVPAREAATLRLLSAAAEDGATAVIVAGAAQEGRLVAAAARRIEPPLVVVLAPSALGFEAETRRSPLGEEDLPEGTLVLDRDLPGPEQVQGLDDVSGILNMEGRAGAWRLAAFDAALALLRAWREAGHDPVKARELLGSGRVAGLRGSFGKPLALRDPRQLRYIPLMVDHGRLKPFPPIDARKPRERPLKAPYDPDTALGPFSRWSTLHFTTRPGTFEVLFSWGKPGERSIEKDLRRIHLATGGRLPALDHLVREKLMARLLSITGAMFGLADNGRLVPARSLMISLVARRTKTKARRRWEAFVAGDDPSAGGRAFGSYCYVYSTFIVRTIFEKFDLTDEELMFEDLATLTGIGLETPVPLGTRPDVISRLVDSFAGSMALTAAHEIGHLCGLGHDTGDPYSIMNVEEGHGIPYTKGHFTRKCWESLERTLGRAPPSR